jgi:hypothetical protein
VDSLVEGAHRGLVHRLRGVSVQADRFVVELQVAVQVPGVPGLEGVLQVGFVLGRSRQLPIRPSA